MRFVVPQQFASWASALQNSQPTEECHHPHHRHLGKTYFERGFVVSVSWGGVRSIAELIIGTWVTWSPAQSSSWKNIFPTLVGLQVCCIGLFGVSQDTKPDSNSYLLGRSSAFFWLFLCESPTQDSKMPIRQKNVFSEIRDLSSTPTRIIPLLHLTPYILHSPLSNRENANFVTRTQVLCASHKA